jgi:hypothetical protein
MNLAKTGYIVSEATLTEITRNYAQGIDTVESIKGDSLRIIVAHSQRELGKWKVRRATTEKAMEAVETAYAFLYGHVLAAINAMPGLAHDDNLPQEERSQRAKMRNAKSGFMRSSKATLVAYLEAGGRLAALDPATVTKEGLRAAVAKATEPGEGDVEAIEDRIDTVETSMEALVKKLAESDPDAARDQVEELIGRLRALVKSAEAPPGKVRPLTARRKRVGEITLHPH